MSYEHVHVPKLWCMWHWCAIVLLLTKCHCGRSYTKLYSRIVFVIIRKPLQILKASFRNGVYIRKSRVSSKSICLYAFSWDLIRAVSWVWKLSFCIEYRPPPVVCTVNPCGITPQFYHTSYTQAERRSTTRNWALHGTLGNISCTHRSLQQSRTRHLSFRDRTASRPLPFAEDPVR